MARKSSLEGRLLAVLSAKSNRRRVSAFLAGLALAISVGVAVPVAMLRATDEQPAEKTKSAVPAAAPAAPATPEKTAMKPKHEYAQALFAKWKANARTDGKIPGALIGQLALEIDSFLKQYPQDEKTPKLAALRPRLDATHDWTQADVVALLDDITAISTAPVSWTDISLRFDAMRTVQQGRPLPAELEKVEWGAPAANGLRVAWLLDPRREQYPLGTVLRSRVLYRNTGKEPVVFSTDTWHQNDPHQAFDAKENAIAISTTHYTGITPSATFRLAPGEYCEVQGHAFAIGAGKYEEENSVGSVGAVVEAKVGDDVRLSHSVEMTRTSWSRPGDPKDPAELWKKDVAERVAQEAPMPKAAADREQLLRRVTIDVLGSPPSAEEIAAFVADDAPDALAKLTARLQARPRPEPYVGTLATGETRFRVMPADPNAAKRPRAANSPGRYVLGDNINLLVSQITTNSQRTNKATIAFLSPDPMVASPHKAQEITLPDGLRTWGAVWERGSGEVWVMQKGLVRKYDFRDPDHVKEIRIEPGSIADVPEPLREVLGKAFNVGVAPAKDDSKNNPNAPAKLPGDKEEILFKKTRVRFTGGMTTIDNGRKTTFQENVRVFYESGSEPGAADPKAPAKGSLSMTCEKLDIVSRKVNERVGDKTVEKTYQEMFADGGSRDVNFRTAEFTGDSKTVKFDEQADIMVFEGSSVRSKQSPPPSKPNFNGNDLQVETTLFWPATIYRSPKVPGGRPETLKGQKIRYNRKTGEFQIKGVNEISSGTAPVDSLKPASQSGPKNGTKVKPGMEERLRWGEPANGLRGALAIRTAGDEPKPGAMPTLYLVVQNVSNAPVHFSDTQESPERRQLYVKRFGQIKAALGFEWPTKVDVTLQPREVAYLLLFPPDRKNAQGPRVGEVIAEGPVKDKDQTLSMKMEIKNAPAGAWNGTLVTGDADGKSVSATSAPQPKDKSGRALFRRWQESARQNGKTPGGLVVRLGDMVKEFIRNNTGDPAGDPFARRMAPLVTRFGTLHDWTPADAIALLDDVAATNSIPLERAL
ncbi:MAG TPA: DUF1549 domain-containing protein, partial [Gemmataceae bacterium]|nr:DUF1549 domain-containing protein [Gemmataceae bacterium]